MVFNSSFGGNNNLKEKCLTKLQHQIKCEIYESYELNPKPISKESLLVVALKRDITYDVCDLSSLLH